MPDTYYLKLKDKVVIEEGMDEDGREYQFTGIIRTDGVNQRPDGKGGMIKTYMAAFVSEMSLIAGDKTLIKVKNKGSKSQQLWRVLQEEARMLGEDVNDYYERQMEEIIKSREVKF